MLSRPFPAGLGPEDFLRHIASLRVEMPARVRHQHAVSQGVLRRFGAADRNNGCELRAVALEFGRSKRRGVAGCGAVDDFVPAASASAERLWQQVENRLGAATDAAEAGTVFRSAEHVDVIKDAVALHFMGSVHLLLAHYRAAAQAWDLLRRAVITRADDLLRGYFFEVTGVHAAGPWALEAAFDDLARQPLPATYGKIRRECGRMPARLSHEAVAGWRTRGAR